MSSFPREEVVDKDTYFNPNTTWDKNPETGRYQCNGHTLELQETDWKCIQCKHYFDAAVDAEKFFCGDPCKHD